MTQTKTGAFLSMGRLPQFVGQAALAASMLAGGASLLNAGGAMAVDCLAATPPQVPVYTPLTGTPPAPGSGTCVSLAINEVDVTNTFSPPVPPSTTSSLTYSLTASPGQWWYEVELDSTHQGTGVSVTKELFSDPALTNKIIPSLVSTDGSVDGPDAIPNTYNTIWVKDSYTTGPNGQLVSINNEFKQTPGPLAILGAGTAFGFSRKLRSRIKAGRTA